MRKHFRRPLIDSMSRGYIMRLKMSGHMTFGLMGDERAVALI
jgi:hypothetical protein